MSTPVQELKQVRDKIISEPELILEDRDVMNALIAANEKSLGNNIVDLRGVAMERLEERLDRLEDTHRSVIAAAYENLAGTNQIQRAVLELLEPVNFSGFIEALRTNVSEILRVERTRLILETQAEDESSATLEKLGETIVMAAPGTIEEYLTGGRNFPSRSVTLRQVSPASDQFYGDAASWIQSEALLKLNLGKGKLPGLLVLGSEDPHQFRPNQGTDILTFFGSVFERSMRRWLS